MDRLIERCCGLDVHKTSIAACVRIPGPEGERVQHVRTFGTTTVQLLALRDWLEAHGVTHVAMESTGVYWKPVYYLLEDRFECLLVNAAHLKHVPGRKTDVQDCVWIAQVLEHGLLRGSFVPPPLIRDLRDLTRYRASLGEERSRQANRLHKFLQDAGLKLSSVASDILGVSGRAMLEALVHGTTDPAVLADLARASSVASSPRCVRRWRVTSGRITAFWSASCLPTWIFSTRASRPSTGGSTRCWPLSPRPWTGWTASRASVATPLKMWWPRSGWTWPSSPAMDIWRAGPVSVRARTRARASGAPAEPAKATAGCAAPSSTPPTRPAAPRIARSRHGTDASPAAARRKPLWQWLTLCSSPSTTCSLAGREEREPL